MRFDAGTTDIATAGTRVQISNTSDAVKQITVSARPGNAGNVFFGVSDVSSTNGITLPPGDSKVWDFGKGSVLFSIFWVDAATNGDDLDWAVIME